MPPLEGVLSEPGGLWMQLILLLLASTLIEALLVRGRLQYQLGQRWGVPATVAISGTLGVIVWLNGGLWKGVQIHALHNRL